MSGGHLQDQLWIRQVPSFYSPAQVREYLSAARFDPLPEENEIEEKKFVRSLESLEKIVRAHLTTFPWENTAMHYSASHTMDVSPQGAFERLVKDGNGSYCFGQNTVLLGILRGLGFRAYSGAGRVNINWRKPEDEEIHTSQTHMVIFVQPLDDSNLTYVVDVGFGGGGLARPIPLVAGDESIVMGVGPSEEHRLIRAPLPQSSLSTSLSSDVPKGQDLWFMQVRDKKTPDGAYGPWMRVYRFSELEYFPTDYADGSFVVAQSQKGIFAEQVLCVKHFVDEQNPEYLYRIVVAGNRVTKQVSGKETEILRTFASEQDRVDALKEIFGITLEEGAIENIKGRPPALA
ncbi:hypothetical protein H1R20_g4671, partial [Candolleomyces eurysporus]